MNAKINDLIIPSKKFYEDWPDLKPGIRRVMKISSLQTVEINKCFIGVNNRYISKNHYKVIHKTKLAKLLYE